MQDPLQQWSKDLPTEPGYYWLWETGTAEAEVVRVVQSERGDYLNVWQLGHHYIDRFVVPVTLELFIFGKNCVWAPANDTHPPLLELWIQNA